MAPSATRARACARARSALSHNWAHGAVLSRCAAGAPGEPAGLGVAVPMRTLASSSVCDARVPLFDLDTLGSERYWHRVAAATSHYRKSRTSPRRISHGALRSHIAARASAAQRMAHGAVRCPCRIPSSAACCLLCMQAHATVSARRCTVMARRALSCNANAAEGSPIAPPHHVSTPPRGRSPANDLTLKSDAAYVKHLTLARRSLAKRSRALRFLQ